MSLVTVLNVSLGFLDKRIFNEIGFQVKPADRIGLIGPNGSGKTTLLRLIKGETYPDTGEIRIAKGTRIGYLPQDIQDTLSGPLLRSVIDSIPGRKHLQNEMEKVGQSLKKVHRSQDP